MSTKSQTRTMFNATDQEQMRKLVELLNNYSQQPEVPAELPDPETQSPAETQKLQEQKQR